MAQDLLIEPARKDALNLELYLQIEPDGTGTVIDKASGRPVQFIGNMSCAKWEFLVREGAGNCLRVTLENIPVIHPSLRA